MAKQVEFTAELLANEALGGGQRLLTFVCPQIAAAARPGQFVALATETFLRRPLGICGVDRKRGHFRVGGRAKGAGMAALLALKPGAQVNVLGPLGNAFNWNKGDYIIACGGGTGVFPLHFLLQEAAEAGCRTAVALGFRDCEQAILQADFKQIADTCLYASEAGDLDVEGTALTALAELLPAAEAWRQERQAQQAGGAGSGQIRLVTCGPLPMMRGAYDLVCPLGIDCQVSLEERMACGVGLCLVCVCAMKGHKGEPDHYARCCKEGPVFPAQDVLWP